MAVTIYHNPRCSKSRATLELIRARGIEPEVVEYLAHPPDAATLKRILAALGMGAGELARRGERAWTEAGLGDDSSDEDILAAMLEYPVLIERPIVVTGNRAVLGRPPENVGALLDELP
ncbi:MAG: arsenate reductase (glutaredoxin) [Gammaproteobacteria bacterium]